MFFFLQTTVNESRIHLSKCYQNVHLKKITIRRSTTTNEWNKENNSGAANFSLLMFLTLYAHTLSLSFFILGHFYRIIIPISSSFENRIVQRLLVVGDDKRNYLQMHGYIRLYFYFFYFSLFLLLFYGVYIVVCFLIFQLSTSTIPSKILL